MVKIVCFLSKLEFDVVNPEEEKPEIHFLGHLSVVLLIQVINCEAYTSEIAQYQRHKNQTATAQRKTYVYEML